MSDPPRTLPRRTHLLGLLALIPLVGCGSKVDSQSQRLIGTWQLLEPEKLADRIHPSTADSRASGELQVPVPAADSPDPDSPAGESLAIPRMTLRFSADGTLETQTQIGTTGSQKKGTWRRLRDDSKPDLLSIECQLNRQTSLHEIEWLDDQTILLNPPNLAGLSARLAFRRTE